MGSGFSTTTNSIRPFLMGARSVFPVFLILVVLVPPGIGQVPDRTAGTITSVAGKAMIKRPGNEQKLSVFEGDDFLVGDELEAAADSAVQMTFADGAFLNLFPGSSVRVNQYSFDPELKRRIVRVKVLAGQARFVLYKVLGGGSTFLVETASAMIVPDMLGDFAVSINEAGTEVVALGRPVRVRNSSNLIVGEVSIEVNEKTVVRNNNRPQIPLTLPRAERNRFMKDIRNFQ